MRTVTETYKAYKFDELTEDQQDKAVENYGDFNVDYEWWEGDWLLGLTTEEMKSRRFRRGDNYPADTGLFSYDKLYFEGVGYSRNRYIQFPDLQVNDDNCFRKFLRIPKRLWEVCEWRFETPAGFGYNAGTTKLVIESDKWDERLPDWVDFTDHQQEIVDQACEIMNDKIDQALTDLQTEYEHQTSRGAISESLRANDYDFTEDGKIA